MPVPNTPVVCLFCEYNAEHVKVIRFKLCTYIQLPDPETNTFSYKWILHNYVGNPQVYPLAWVEFVGNEKPAETVPWLEILHRWGKVDFKFNFDI
jgi:hypothetical protein